LRAHLTNAAYGVLDYIAYPAGMLLVAPVLLHRLGAAQYGVWAIATAAISAGGVIASGFGDANIQHLATTRHTENKAQIEKAVRSMMGINLLLGAAMALVSLVLSPAIARHVALNDSSVYNTILITLRLASLLMLVRAIESVCVSSQRAFERYGLAVRVSIVARLLTLASAVILVRNGGQVVSMMLATTFFMVVGTLIQIAQLKRDLQLSSVWPAFDRKAMATLFAIGVFTWIQAVSGVVFGQVDKLFLGVSLGATAVASYTLCVQMAQPVYGIAASGLHFIFPYIAGRQALESAATLKRTVAIVFSINLLIVLSGAAFLLILGPFILRIWIGNAVAQDAACILPSIVWSAALLGLNITGSYTLLALGRVRVLTCLNITGGGAMILLMTFLLPHYGTTGLIAARTAYALIALLVYWPISQLLFAETRKALPIGTAKLSHTSITL
jgi:O-antigen/teichoic acid export membrane protein